MDGFSPINYEVILPIIAMIPISCLIFGICAVINLCEKIRAEILKTDFEISKKSKVVLKTTLTILFIEFIFILLLATGNLAFHISELKILGISFLITALLDTLFSKIKRVKVGGEKGFSKSAKILFFIGLIIIIGDFIAYDLLKLGYVTVG